MGLFFDFPPTALGQLLKCHIHFSSTLLAVVFTGVCWVLLWLKLPETSLIAWKRRFFVRSLHAIFAGALWQRAGFMHVGLALYTRSVVVEGGIPRHTDSKFAALISSFRC